MRSISNGSGQPLKGLVTVRLGLGPGRSSDAQTGAGRRQGAAPPQRQQRRTDPLNAMMLAASADALRVAGRVRDAIAMFDRVIAADARNLVALFGRAAAHEASGSLDEAERDYRRVIELAPSTAAGFAGLASVLAMKGKLEEARAYANFAAVRGPNESTTIIAQARCDRLGGDHAAAAQKLERLSLRTGLAPNDAIIAFGLLGDALDRLDERDRAFEAYARANQRFLAAHVSPGRC